jgi:hypothetical protein
VIGYHVGLTEWSVQPRGLIDLDAIVTVVLPIHLAQRVTFTPTVLVVASKTFEKLAGRVPYLQRLHARIGDLHHRLAMIETSLRLKAPPDAQSPNIGEQFRAFLRLLRPHDALGVEKRRFGANNDGGYVMLDDLGRSSTALSLGVGGEVSWDLSMVDGGLHVVQFDDAASGPPQYNPGFTFNRARVVGRAELPDDITLAQIFARSDLARDNDLIAKIDVEGWEWEVLKESPKEALARMRQIAIEFHDLGRFVDPAWRATALAAVENLLQTHACIHVHGNNWGPLVAIGGIAFPSVFEATFARRSDYGLAPSMAVFPTELDRPNNPKALDLYLGRWTY